MEGKKKRRVSKKSKKNWRKHSNVKDVEEYLEDRGREEIFGLPASEKTAEELFFVHKDITDESTATKPTRKELRRKPLKSEINIKSAHSLDSSSEEEFESSVSYRAISEEQRRRLVDRRKKCPKKSTVHTACKDLWSEEPERVPLNDEHYLKVTRQHKVRKPRTLSEVPSLLRSVELPHAGMSYNPTFEDHQELLRTALSVEEKRVMAAEKLEKRLQLAKLTSSEREKVWLEEMSEGIPGEKVKGHLGEREEQKGEEEEEGLPVGKRPIRAEDRKTKKQRRKELLRKKEEMIRKIAKAQKLKMHEIYRLRSIKKELKGKEEAILRKKAATAKLKQLSPYLTKRLGKYAFKESSIPIQLSSEVTGSLRSLRPEGNIAEERFKSLQKRNIIEPRELVRPHRKYKLLIKEKRSAKIPEDKN